MTERTFPDDAPWREKLLIAADNVRSEGKWRRGEYVENEGVGPCCAVGWIADANRQTVEHLLKDPYYVCEAHENFQRYIGERTIGPYYRYERGNSGTHAVENWNDAKGRTASQVADAMEDCAYTYIPKR